MSENPTPPELSPEQKAARGRRNLWTAIALAAFMLLIFIVTLTRLQASILERPL